MCMLPPSISISVLNCSSSSTYIGLKQSMTDLSKEPWYHGRVSRPDAEKTLDQMGAVEGSFLVRDSLSMTGEYVLSLCHQVSKEGERLTILTCG